MEETSGQTDVQQMSCVQNRPSKTRNIEITMTTFLQHLNYEIKVKNVILYQTMF